MKITFGITTDYSNPQQLNEVLDSIHALNIPEYEIIVIGSQYNLFAKNTLHITFDETVKPGWTTRKKNILCQEAKYENIVLMHDYYVFDKDWYINMEQFTKDVPWDICSCQQILTNGKRHFTDWVVWDDPIFPRYSALPYDEWTRANYMYVSGGFFMVKKQVALDNPFNENLVHGQAEMLSGLSVYVISIGWFVMVVQLFATIRNIVMQNKLIIFDLDGVLIESRELHYDALNEALNRVGNEFVITREEHLSVFDGLNTTKKLEMLSERKGLDRKYFNQIWQDKQTATFNLIRQFPRDDKLRQMFAQIQSKGIKIAVASNSIRETIKLALLSIGVMEFVDYYVSNEDVSRTKPFPEMYWKCMTALNVLPKNTVIIEDSHIGRQGALDSGAHLVPVRDSFDLTYEKIDEAIDTLNGVHRKKIPWRNKKMNVLIPMAGAGSRFANAGYTFPKPLIEVNGKPMIQVVVENLNVDAHFIFLVQKEHYEKYNLKQLLNLIAPGCDIVQVDGLTEGAACTTLLAKELIDNDEPLMMANSDQFVEWNSNEVMYAFTADTIGGGIVTFKATHPKWSFAKVGEDGFVSEVAEKNPISDEATVGIYFWNKGSDYVKYAEQMIEKNVRTNGEFYVCPVFNEAIQDGKRIRVKQIDKMWGIGTPEDLNYFLEHYKGTV